MHSISGWSWSQIFFSIDKLVKIHWFWIRSWIFFSRSRSQYTSRSGYFQTAEVWFAPRTHFIDTKLQQVCCVYIRTWFCQFILLRVFSVIGYCATIVLPGVCSDFTLNLTFWSLKCSNLCADTLPKSDLVHCSQRSYPHKGSSNVKFRLYDWIDRTFLPPRTTHQEFRGNVRLFCKSLQNLFF